MQSFGFCASDNSKMMILFLEKSKQRTENDCCILAIAICYGSCSSIAHNKKIIILSLFPRFFVNVFFFLALLLLMILLLLRSVPTFYSPFHSHSPLRYYFLTVGDNVIRRIKWRVLLFSSIVYRVFIQSDERIPFLSTVEVAFSEVDNLISRQNSEELEVYAKLLTRMTKGIVLIVV